VPCHRIPLNESGDTVEALEGEEDQQRLEEAVKDWLLAKIKQIEQERSAL
jgi:hypothetical protein